MPKIIIRIKLEKFIVNVRKYIGMIKYIINLITLMNYNIVFKDFNN